MNKVRHDEVKVQITFFRNNVSISSSTKNNTKTSGDNMMFGTSAQAKSQIDNMT